MQLASRHLLSTETRNEMEIMEKNDTLLLHLFAINNAMTHPYSQLYELFSSYRQWTQWTQDEL